MRMKPAIPTQSARLFMPFAAWLLLGSVGIAALALSQDIDALRALGAFPEGSDFVLRLLIRVQPTFLLVTGVGAGVALGESLGLRSWLTARLRGDLPAPMAVSGLVGAALAGGGAGAVVVNLDMLLAPWTGVPLVASRPPVGAAVTALIYGGITEELMLRYGFMTFLAWIGALVWTTLPPGLYLGSLLVSAVVFGAAHLPAMAAITPLTLVVILRTVGLNALLALVYG